MTAGFDENQLGRISNEQRKFLISELILRLAIIVLIVTPIAVSFIQSNGTISLGIPLRLLGWIILISVIVMVASFLWTYSRDLYFYKPVRNSGVIKKYRKKRLRGQDFYCIKIEKHQFFNPEIFTTGEKWHGLQDGQSYDLYFAKNTRWLLSWREINPR